MSISAVLLHPAWGLAHRVGSVNYPPVFSGTEPPEGGGMEHSSLPQESSFLGQGNSQWGRGSKA